MYYKLVLFSYLSLIGFYLPGQNSYDREIDSLLDLMTIEEKIGQLTLFTSGWDQTGPSLGENYTEDVRSGKAGNIFNAHTVSFNKKLQDLAVNESRLGIPLLFGYDVIHGYKTIFPIPLAQSCTWDMELIEKAAQYAAREASAAGLHWTFAPMVDISRDPRWGRIAEGAGEDPYLGSEIAKAQVRGFQGDDLSSQSTLLACVKHFAAYGAAQAGRDYHSVDLSERSLREIYLPPFKAAIEAGAGSIMTAFNDLNGIPASCNRWLLTDILREEWGFKGFVVSDYTSINELVPHGIAADEKMAGELAFHAGLDMDMQGAVFYRFMSTSLTECKTTEKEIDEAVRRVLQMKFELGLFNDPYRYLDPERERRIVLSDELKDFAYEIAKESIVLLKNENRVLPLTNKDLAIALVGPLADDPLNMMGSWHAAGNAGDAVSVKMAFDKVEGLKWVYSKGCDIEGQDTSLFSEAILMGMDADVIVAVVGEHYQMSGEAASKARIRIPDLQLRLLKRLKQLNKPMVVVLSAGRPLVIPWISEHADAVIAAWQLGTMAGPAITDVLLGHHNPAGKLTAAFPRHEGQIPIFYAVKNTGRPMDPNQKYTSKYLDMSNDPLYSFGYGLSYTTFEYANHSVENSIIATNESTKVKVTVTNSGDAAGSEIVQLYIRDVVGSVTRPLRELKGFQKVWLDPGETAEVFFDIGPNELIGYNAKMQWAVEPGDFEVFVGANSMEGKPMKIKVQPY